MSISSIKPSIDPSSFIDDGYGELLIYKAESATNTPSLLDEKTYRLCYQVLLKSKKITDEDEKEFFLEGALAKIDPNIKVTFIPRTLYELCFIEKCMKETLRLRDICKNSTFKSLDEAEPKCWHGAYFRDFGEDLNDLIISLAYRLNKSIIRNLKTSGSFSYNQITSMANEKLEFLYSCHEDSNSDRYKKLLKAVGKNNCTDMTLDMITEYYGCKPLGIQTEKMKKILLNAIAVECSKEAKGKLIIYRGLVFDNDKPLEYNEMKKVIFVQSLSYGTGPFSGSVHDRGATSFYHMRKEGKNAIAILVPKEEAASSPFAIPTTHTLCQLFGRGEEFHVRTKAPTIDVDPEVPIGCKGGAKLGKVGNVSSHLLLAITPQEFDDRFQYYMKNHVVDLN